MESVAFYDWIFDEALFKQEAQRFYLGRTARIRAEKALGRFQQAWQQKRLVSVGNNVQISELKAQQAFNQVIFCELLGYSDMMSDGYVYDLLPEVSFDLLSNDGRSIKPRTDLAIGVFSRSDFVVSGVTELKSPQADLFLPQKRVAYQNRVTGEYLSAMQQSVEAMLAAHCDWALVSNMKHICLIHRTDTKHVLAFDLTELDIRSITDLYFAFGPGGFSNATARPSRLNLLYERVRRLTK